MPNEIKPIRRSRQLAPLSREHHEGLLCSWKIKQGLRNGTDTKIIARFVQWFWRTHLQNHFKQEEQLLLSCLPDGDKLGLQMLQEHQNIEALVLINENIPDAAMLLQLAAILDAHIRFEERELFGYIEKKISKNALNSIEQQLLKNKATDEKWDEEFWLKKAE